MAMASPRSLPGRMTVWIAAANLSIFLILLLTDQVEAAALIGGIMPARFSDPALFDGLNAVPVWLTPLSATLIHAGWAHIGFNMFMLLFCGLQVEHVFNRWLTLLLYVVGAYAAAFAQWVADPASTASYVGASGAISALIANYALLYSRQQIRRVGPLSANIIRMLWLAAAWIGVQMMLALAVSTMPGGAGSIGVAAHIGGFLAGLLMTRPLLHWRFRARPAA